MSELKKRILLALIAAPLFIYLTWLGGWFFISLMTIVALIIQWEMSSMFELGGSRPNRFIMYLFGIWILLLPYIPRPELWGLALFLLLVLTEIVRGADRSYNSLVNTIFCGVYAPIGVLTLIILREKMVPGDLESFVLTLTLLFMVWGNDVFAFIFGKNFGKNLLAPKISPKKTWEGFFGGAFGTVVGFFLIYFLIPGFPYELVYFMPVFVLVAIFGPIGDLAASKLKRLYGAKDSSRILPGHGGFFDRFDALLLAAPAVFLYLQVLKAFGLLN